jgi:hypothetical protein
MGHGIHRVTSFEVTGEHTLRVEFEDGVTRSIDFEPILAGELYGPLRDPEVFRRVRLDSEIGTLVWANGADFDPATLHDWPQVVHDLTLMARRWRDEERKNGTG